MTAWTDLVKKIYNEHKGEAGYKLGDAMKEAKKQYKKGPSVSEPEPVALSAKPTKKRRGKARKTRRSKK